MKKVLKKLKEENLNQSIQVMIFVFYLDVLKIK